MALALGHAMVCSGNASAMPQECPAMALERPVLACLHCGGLERDKSVQAGLLLLGSEPLANDTALLSITRRAGHQQGKQQADQWDVSMAHGKEKRL